MTSAFCRCFCGKEFEGIDPGKNLGKDFDDLYEIDNPPVQHPQTTDVLSYEVSVDQPLRGKPVRQGKLWYLLAEEKIVLVLFSLYVNGFSFTFEGKEVSIALSPFALVRNCKFQESYSNISIMDLKIFKLSLFTQNVCYYYGVRAADDAQAEEERQKWVMEIAKAVQLVTQSLFPPFSISCEPLDSVVTTLRRLMAGYVLYHDAATVATVLYCELHPHCGDKDHAKLAFYENELCQRLVMDIRVTVGTICCEKVGVNCSCFCIDGHQFSTRTCAERRLWLRAISNIKVKLQNRAPTPTTEDIRHYRSAIEEHIGSIRSSLEGLGPIDALLQRLPARRPPEQRGSYAMLRDVALGIPSVAPSRGLPMPSLGGAGGGSAPSRPLVAVPPPAAAADDAAAAVAEVFGSTPAAPSRGRPEEDVPSRQSAGGALAKPSSLSDGSPGDADNPPSPTRPVAQTAGPRPAAAGPGPGPAAGNPRGPKGGAAGQSADWRPQEPRQPSMGDEQDLHSFVGLGLR